MGRETAEASCLHARTDGGNVCGVRYVVIEFSRKHFYFKPLETILSIFMDYHFTGRWFTSSSSTALKRKCLQGSPVAHPRSPLSSCSVPPCPSVPSDFFRVAGTLTHSFAMCFWMLSDSRKFLVLPLIRPLQKGKLMLNLGFLPSCFEKMGDSVSIFISEPFRQLSLKIPFYLKQNF